MQTAFNSPIKKPVIHRVVITILISCLLTATAGASSVSAKKLILKDNQDNYNLMDYLEFLEDPQGTLTIDEVTDGHNRSRFEPRTGPKSNFGFSKSVFWARLQVENRSSQTERAVLIDRFNVATADHIDLYVPLPDGGFRRFQDGETVPTKLKMMPEMVIPAFKVNIASGQTETVYFRIEDEGLLFLPIHLFSFPALAEHKMKQLMWVTLMGAFGFFFLYNLLLYSSLRDPVFLYFSLVLLGVPLAIVLAELNRFVPGLSIWWSNRIKEQGQLYNCIAWLLLTKSYYKINHRAPVLNRWTWSLLFGCLLLGISFFLLPFHWVLQTRSWLNIAVSLSLLIISVHFSRKGFAAGRFYLVAVCFTFIPAYFNNLNSLGIISSQLIQDRMMMLANLYISLLLFSLALIDRHNILAKQMLAAQQLAMQSMQQAEQAKDEFLANTSHELRTPLHGIIGLTEDLLERCKRGLTNGWQNELNIIIHSGRRLSALIDDILDVTRIKQGRLHLAVKPVDFYSILSLVIALCRPLINPEKVGIQVNLPDELPLILADEDRLQQIMINLVKNAINFTSEGHIQISAKVATDHLDVAVQDSGVGIPLEQQTAIFDRFTQVDGTMDRAHGGTGLGLAITRQLVELQGGRISVKSAPGEGACFSFTIPLAAEDTPTSPVVMGTSETPSSPNALLASALLPDLTASGNENMNGARILIVDDEQISLHVLYNHLTTVGYNVTSAHDAFEAGSLLETHSFDLIVLDIMMPRLNGYAFCRKIRRDFNPTELPVIMLTARSQTDDLIQGFDCGANDYLTKPVNRLELLARIQTSLKLKHLADLLRENKGLKEDIVRRKRAEKQLHIANRQLVSLLNLWEAALLMVDEHCRILYFNQCAETLFGYQFHEVVNRPLALLFQSQIDLIRQANTTAQPEQILSEKMPSLQQRIMARTAEDESIVLEVIITPMLVHDGSVVYALICRQEAQSATQPLPSEQETVQALARHHQKLQAMRGAFESALNHLQQEGRHLNAELRQIDQTMTDTFERMPKKELNLHFRKAVVELMTNALACWTESTGEDKVALAERSGIWRTYLDVNTYKTRTLDKYLNLEKLPKNPRWKDVIKTADFVLNNSRSDLLTYKTLAASLTQLNVILRVKELL